MHPLTEPITLFLSVLTVLSQVTLCVLWILAGFRKRTARAHKALHLFFRNSIPLSFIIALTGLTGSLFYSEIAGFEPCTLCWYQRILMYPLTLLFGMAMVRSERHIVPYALLLSVTGAMISSYHYALQIGIVPALVCSAVGYSESCSNTFSMTFGYITIPMMALTAFALITTLLLLPKQLK